MNNNADKIIQFNIKNGITSHKWLLDLGSKKCFCKYCKKQFIAKSGKYKVCADCKNFIITFSSYE